MSTVDKRPATKSSAAAKPTKTEGTGAVWLEDVVKPEGLLGLRLGASLEVVVKALKAKDAPRELGAEAIVSGKVGGNAITASVGAAGLTELAVFIAHKGTKEAEHKAVAKELKAFLTERYGKPGGKPKFPEWQVAGTPAYRLWMCSWKVRDSDFGSGSFATKIVMDVHVA